MKLPHLFMLLSALILAGCNTLGSSPIDPENNQSKVDTPPTNTKYLCILDLVDQFREFDEEDRGYLLSKAKIAGCPSEIISRLEGVAERCSQFVEEIYEQTLSLLNGNKSIDEYLYYLLKTRFNYLDARQKVIEKILAGNLTPESTFMYPTSKELFDFVMKDITSPMLKAMFDLDRLYEVHKFELLNQLIKESFNNCTLAELQPKTIELLRASKQLHPLLMGEQSALLGHPDQAGGPFAILELIVIEPKQQTDRSIHGKRLKKLLDVSSLEKDIAQQYASENTHPNKLLLGKLFSKIKSYEEYYEQHREKMRNGPVATHKPIQKPGIPQEKGANQAKKKVQKTADRIANKTAKKINTKAAKKENEQVAKKVAKSSNITTEVRHLKKDLDVEICQLHFSYNQLLFQIKSLSGMQENPFEGGLFELPDPAFLKPQQVPSEPTYNRFSEKNVYTKLQVLPKTQVDEISQEPVQPEINPPQQEMNCVAPAAPQKEIDPFQQGENYILSTVPLQEEAKLPFQKELVYVSPLEVPGETEVGEGLAEEIKETPIEEREIVNVVVGTLVRYPASTFSFRDWDLPRGLRSFHDQMFQNPYQPCYLQGTHQHTVDQLFDPQQQCDVTFQQFKNLWKHIGGDIVGGKGGSHRQLIGPKLPEELEGKKLFGIFAHNNNQVYGPNYVKYLQTAVLYVGLRPTQGLGKANK